MKRYWIAFTSVIVVGFIVLGWAGYRIYQEKPPIPDQVLTQNGKVLISSGEISEGQNVWQAMGGMELGSVWGHGSYVAPDWSADWLHRECTFILDAWSIHDQGKKYAELSNELQALYRERLSEMMRKNTFDPQTGNVIVDSIRGEAFEANVKHFSQVFSEGKSEYAIPSGASDRSGKTSTAFRIFLLDILGCIHQSSGR